MSEQDRERGRELLHELMQLPGTHIDTVDDEDAVGEFLAAAITTARAEQREADAKIAEAHNDAHPNGGDYKNCALTIAEAIREGREKP